jgi:AraC family transcriptional regulator
MTPRPRLAIELKPVERLHFRSTLTAIGRHACPPADPSFREPRPCPTFAFAFPRSATEIRPSRAPAFVESPDVVSFFNRGVPYAQRAMSPAGAQCDFFVVEESTLQEAVARHDPDAAADPSRLFRTTHVPASDSLYLRQRGIVDAVRRDCADSDEVDEAVLRLLEDLLALANERFARPRARGRTAARDLVAGAQAILAETYREPLALSAIARELGTSPSYLCRVFRRQTGTSMSAYRRTLRLRDALGWLSDSTADLGEITARLGFSSHSHFTSAFRRAFGTTPSRFRDALPARA